MTNKEVGQALALLTEQVHALKSQNDFQSEQLKSLKTEVSINNTQLNTIRLQLDELITGKRKPTPEEAYEAFLKTNGQKL